MSGTNQVDQISIVVKDLEKAMKLYSRIFRLTNWKVMTPKYTGCTFRGQPGDFKLKVALARVGNVELELIQPLEGRSVNAEFLHAYGEGLHHIGISVTNMKEKIVDLVKLGLEVVQSGRRLGNTFAYLQDEAHSSIIIELFERSHPINYGRVRQQTRLLASPSSE